jgi:prophage regulatory protein
MTRFLRRPAVEAITGLSRSTIYSLMQTGSFPRPARIGDRAVAWPEAEIEAWIAERLQNRGGV